MLPATSLVEGDEHTRLVAEIPAVQRLPIGERLLLARRRRMEQVTRYERWLLRSDYNSAVVDGRRSKETSAARSRGRHRAVRFAAAVALLEAVRRCDIDEG